MIFLCQADTSKSQPNSLCDSKTEMNFMANQYESEPRSSKCNLIHLNDVELFHEKAVTGVAALEGMKEQIDILEDLIRKYVEEVIGSWELFYLV